MTDDAALSSYSWQPFKKAYCHTVKKETECRNNKGNCGGKNRSLIHAKVLRQRKDKGIGNRKNLNSKELPFKTLPPSRL